MKTIVILLSFCLAGSSLFLVGCSKSAKSGPASNNGSNSSASSANGASAAAGPTDLKIKWQTGKEYDMQMDLRQSTEINMPGHAVIQEVNITQGFHYSPLKDLDSGGHQVKLEFDRQVLDITQNGKDMLNYDSTQKTPIPPDSPAAPVAAVMGAMLGVPLDYTFAADGSVEKIDGMDSLTNRIAAAMPDQRQRVALQQLFDEDTLKQYGSFSQSLPGHPVNVGDSWSSSHDISNPTGVMTVNATYTFQDWEQHNGHNCAHLLVTGDITTKTASAATIGAVVKVQKGTINGDSWFDADLGMFVDVNTDQELTLNIMTRGMSFTELMKQNIKLSLLGVNP